ncbi:hypothetical protein GCM10009639_12070 [Kitasatospora putterlickiae]|uniref:Uncharacterized protein n=1 Tax=Kitasatospora putterlickiae TaxID=221725 RepID=A0ABN1XQA9_9ACTN
MRLRNALLAATSAIALVLAVPLSANAATGEFRYKYGADDTGALIDPKSRSCIDLPEATAAEPAFAPSNQTGSTATVFLDSGCAGDTYFALRPGGRAGNRLLVRSVVFS